MVGHFSSPLSSNLMELRHPYKSIGLVQAALPPVSPVSTVTSTTGVVKHTDDARFSIVQPGAIILRQGEILVYSYFVGHHAS